MNILQIIGGVLLIISSILIVILVVMQDSKQSGLGALGGQSDSYLSRNKGKTLESKLVLTTKIFAVVFFVLALAMNIIIRYVK